MDLHQCVVELVLASRGFVGNWDRHCNKKWKQSVQLIWLATNIPSKTFFHSCTFPLSLHHQKEEFGLRRWICSWVCRCVFLFSIKSLWRYLHCQLLGNAGTSIDSISVFFRRAHTTLCCTDQSRCVLSQCIGLFHSQRYCSICLWSNLQG